VEVDAEDAADLAEEFDDFDGVELDAGGFAERIAAGVADGPETKGELVGGRCGEGVMSHGDGSWQGVVGSRAW